MSSEGGVVRVTGSVEASEETSRSRSWILENSPAEDPFQTLYSEAKMGSKTRTFLRSNMGSITEL